MFGALINLVMGLFKVFLQPRPTRAENNAREAVSAEVNLDAERKANADIAKAAAAVASVERATADDAGVRTYAARDPNNRANQ